VLVGCCEGRAGFVRETLPPPPPLAKTHPPPPKKPAHPRDARQRRELVRRRLGRGARQQSEQRRLADRREPDQRHAAVAVLLDVEALARAAFGRGRLQLCAQLGQPRLELAQVVLGGLVALRARHLRLDLLDPVVVFLWGAIGGEQVSSGNKQFGAAQKKQQHAQTLRALSGRPRTFLGSPWLLLLIR